MAANPKRGSKLAEKSRPPADKLRTQKLAYLFFSLAALLLSCLYWGYLGALVQQSNADQLVSSFLFGSSATFHGAFISGQHTFLLKWPLFVLVRAFDYSAGIFIGLTMTVVTATVGLFAYILYRIERRPLVFGTICLAIAATLIAIPPEPVAGAILPVNMAMLTTRNIEYIFYIVSLGLLATAKPPLARSPRFWLSIIVLGLLIASDRLFLSLSIGGAILLIAAYTLARRWDIVHLGLAWLTVGISSGILGIGTVWLLAKTKVIHVVADAGASPYSLISSFHELLHGVVYAPMDLATNFGANPAFSAVVIKNIPGSFFSHLLRPSGFGYLVNLVVLVIIFIASIQLVMISFRKPPKHPRKAKPPAARFVLTLFLLWSTIEAILAFIASTHYYPVDSRYLTIAYFAGFVALATYASAKKWLGKGFQIGRLGLVLTLALFAGVFLAHRYYDHDMQALATTNNNNVLVANALQGHQTSVLVGNYWRVIPIKQKSNQGRQGTLPLSGCTTASNVQTSANWQVDLKQTSFAYLLTFAGGPSNFPACSLSQVIAAYGRPNASVRISGTTANPQETLLYYDHGADYVPIKKKPSAQQLATVLPISINKLSAPICTGKETVLNIVAHEDDDLLFMNPDIIHQIQAGDCMRTVYITAGDSGNGERYWLKRQQGSEAAYNTMLSVDAAWTERIIQLPDREYITLASPIGFPNTSLIFMHLPDGNLDGQGFKADGYQSLAQLLSGHISEINTVDEQSTYTSAQLTDGLTAIMNRYKPAIIQTQAPVNLSTVYADHSDHVSTGQFVQKAYAQYLATDQNPAQVTYYIGYPIRARPANITGLALAEKEAAFFSYAAYDGNACTTIQGCSLRGAGYAYGFYLQREYQYYP